MDWQDELPALAELSDQDAAAAINAMTVQDVRIVFGSFRTFAALLTAMEYNTFRAVLAAAVAAEAQAGGYLYADMTKMLELPGDEDGNGGGLDLGNASFVASLAALASQSQSLTDVPAKIAAYVASKQPAPRQKYPGRLRAWQIADARQHLET